MRKDEKLLLCANANVFLILIVAASSVLMYEVNLYSSALKTTSNNLLFKNALTTAKKEDQ